MCLEISLIFYYCLRNLKDQPVQRVLVLTILLSPDGWFSSSDNTTRSRKRSAPRPLSARTAADDHFDLHLLFKEEEKKLNSVV